jgi:hypothetical protein
VIIGIAMNKTSRQSCDRPTTLMRIGTVNINRIGTTTITTITTISVVRARPTSVSLDTDLAVCLAVALAPMPTSTHRRAPEK